ncbi:MAG: DMT family transporter [Candidatus Bathyarchaeia archaeon]
MKNSSVGYLLVVAASVLWGTMGILGKMAFEHGITPVTLTALRISITSVIVLIPLFLFRKKLLEVNKKDVTSLLILGVFAVAFQRIAYFYAVELTTATIAAILFYTYPIFITIYATAYLKKKATFITAFSVGTAFFGTVLVMKAYELSWLSINVWGIASGFLSSLLFAVYFMTTKKLRDSYTNWTLLAYGDGIGAITLSPALFFSFSELATYSSQLWALILIIALIPSLTAYLIFSYALKYVNPSKGSILSVIEPLSAALFSATILGETLEPPQLLGAALSLIGIATLFYKSKI